MAKKKAKKKKVVKKKANKKKAAVKKASSKKVKKKPKADWDWADDDESSDADYWGMTCFRRKGTLEYTSPPEGALTEECEYWHSGEPLEHSFKVPMVFTVYEREDRGRGLLRPIIDDIIPLFSDEVIQVLKDCGVQNMECFPAVIDDKVAKKKYKGYQAVNIVGYSKAMELEWGEIEYPIFRAIEASTHILVSNEIKVAIEEAGIEGIDFRHPDDLDII